MRARVVAREKANELARTTLTEFCVGQFGDQQRGGHLFWLVPLPLQLMLSFHLGLEQLILNLIKGRHECVVRCAVLFNKTTPAMSRAAINHFCI